MVAQQPQDFVNSLALLPGDRLASASDDHTIVVSSLVDGTVLATLGGDSNAAVCALAVLPDGRLVSATGDGVAHVWTLAGERGVTQLTLTGHADVCRAVACSASGATIYTGSDDGTIREFDSVTGALPRPRRSACAARLRAATGGGAGECRRDIAAHSSWVWALCMLVRAHAAMPAASRAVPRASASAHPPLPRAPCRVQDEGTLASGSKDCSIKLWREGYDPRRRLAAWRRALHANGPWSSSHAECVCARCRATRRA